jgi:hypothetical protein
VKLVETCCRQARMGLEPETDRALALTLAWLPHLDDGDAEATLTRLWERANRLLHQPPHLSRLDRLADALFRVRRVSGQQVAQLLNI